MPDKINNETPNETAKAYMRGRRNTGQQHIALHASHDLQTSVLASQKHDCRMSAAPTQLSLFLMLFAVFAALIAGAEFKDSKSSNVILSLKDTFTASAGSWQSQTYLDAFGVNPSNQKDNQPQNPGTEPSQKIIHHMKDIMKLHLPQDSLSTQQGGNRLRVFMPAGVFFLSEDEPAPWFNRFATDLYHTVREHHDFGNNHRANGNNIALEIRYYAQKDGSMTFSTVTGSKNKNKHIQPLAILAAELIDAGFSASQLSLRLDDPDGWSRDIRQQMRQTPDQNWIAIDFVMQNSGGAQ